MTLKAKKKVKRKMRYNSVRRNVLNDRFASSRGRNHVQGFKKETQEYMAALNRVFRVLPTDKVKLSKLSWKKRFSILRAGICGIKKLDMYIQDPWTRKIAVEYRDGHVEKIYISHKDSSEFYQLFFNACLAAYVLFNFDWYKERKAA